ADGQRSNLEVVQLALEILGRPVDDFDLVPDRPGHDVRYAIDASKLRTQLGWTPQFSDFESGLVATIDWYRGNEAWWRPQKTATEEQYRRRARSAARRVGRPRQGAGRRAARRGD